MLNADLEAIKKHPLVTGIPSHTQSTERAVKLTTEAIGSGYGADRQAGTSLNKIAYRKRQSGQVAKCRQWLQKMCVCVWLTRC